MIVYWLLFVVLLLWGCRFRSAEQEDVLGRVQTTTVNGFFIGWVFLRHVGDYFSIDGALSRPFVAVDHLIDQLIVATFLFFSGYGVMEQIKVKGTGYVASFPKKRLLKVLLDFDVAVAIFVVAGLLIGGTFTVRRVALSLIGWDDVGNSNWYIFIILICYAVTFAVYQITAQKRELLALLVSLLSVGLALFYCKGYWWWDTLLAYGAGMAYSQYKQPIEKRLMRRWWLWLAVFIVGSGLWRGLAKVVGLDCPARVVFLNLRTIFFAMAIVMVMMKVSFGNKVINWVGAHLFPIYIYQRLVMMVMVALCGKELVNAWPYAYVIVCAALTAGMAVVYDKWLRVKL